MEPIKQRRITLNVTLSTIRYFLTSCIKAILSRKGIYPVGTTTREDHNGVVQAMLQNAKIESYIDEVVLDVEVMVKKNRNTCVSISISTHDLKIFEFWNININVLYPTEATASTINFVPKLVDYLNQIVLAAGSFTAGKPPYIFHLTMIVDYPFK